MTAFGLFCLASAALAVVPGPAVTYIVTQSVDKGRRAGLTSALGVASGGLVHVAAATAGLSAVIASSATAFTTVKLVGAVYLVVVGIRRILSKDPDAEIEVQPAPLRQLYTQGVIVNVFNPKTALFFLAFLPQFVNPDKGSVALQVGLLGITFALIAFASDVIYALLASFLAGKLRRTGTGARLRRWVSGGIFIVLGVTAATAHRVS
ncbi:MAG TPA: LysE family translocator [Gaiellaceae bacterium]|nr:LysE family translocator [Gaiellaceae bacterium]